MKEIAFFPRSKIFGLKMNSGENNKDEFLLYNANAL